MKASLSDFYLDELSSFLNKSLPFQSELKSSLPYSVMPAGKLFRPLLCLNLAIDLKLNISKDVLYLAHFCELHHAYSLVHDDLPAMDDDDYRRGKLSVHKKFGEATAILTGDALINLSYQALSHIETQLNKILKLTAWATGAKGLILGQELDLSFGEKSLEDTLLIHKLKTSRLIQVATAGTSLLSDASHFRRFVDFMKLGENLGIIFQLLDDLSELSEEVSFHEKEINPFLKFNSCDLFKLIKIKTNFLNQKMNDYHLIETEKFLSEFFSRSKNKILKKKDIIEEVLKEKIDL